MPKIACCPRCEGGTFISLERAMYYGGGSKKVLLVCCSQADCRTVVGVIDAHSPRVIADALDGIWNLLCRVFKNR
jgi:hypothetical protein